MRVRRLLGILGTLALLGCQVVPGALAQVGRPVTQAQAMSRSAVDFEPAKTYALFIGVLEWQDPNLEPFPKEDRQDRALERALVARGVPQDHIVFLEDRQATLANIRKALTTLQTQAGADSTLMVYFAGHGWREHGVTYLCNYDLDSNRLAQTGFGVRELGDRLSKGWHGKRLLLMGDCCYSGALAEAAQMVGAKGIPAASLSSVSPTDGSTERWTFSESLVQAMKGDGRLDTNRDGIVTFAETDVYIHDQMKYGEDQLTKGFRAGGFEPGWRISPAALAPLPGQTNPPTRWNVGDYAETTRQGKREPVQILNLGPNGAFVHYLTLPDAQDGWLAPAALQPIPATQFRPGQQVQVEYDGEWLPAVIQKSEENYFNFVHYATIDDSDEWVTDRRLRLPGSSR